MYFIRSQLFIFGCLIAVLTVISGPLWARSTHSFPARLICQQINGSESFELELSPNKTKIYEGYLYSGPNKSQALVFAPQSSKIQKKTQGVVLKGSGNLQMELAVIREIVVGGFSEPGRIVLQTSKTIKNKLFDHCWMTWTQISGRLDQVEI